MRKKASKQVVPEKFAVGNKVIWISQAQGTWLNKEGTVVEIVAPGKRPTSPLKTPGGPRDHESYVAEVAPGPRAKPKYYWPRVADLVRDHIAEMPAKAKSEKKQIGIFVDPFSGEKQRCLSHKLETKPKPKPYWVGVRADAYENHDVFQDDQANVTRKNYPQYDYTLGPYTDKAKAEAKARSEKNQTGMFTDPFCNDGGGR